MWRLPATRIDAMPPTREDLVRLAAPIPRRPALIPTASSPTSCARAPRRRVFRSCSPARAATISSPAIPPLVGPPARGPRARLGPRGGQPDVVGPRARAAPGPCSAHAPRAAPGFQPAFAARIALDDRLRRTRLSRFPLASSRQATAPPAAWPRSSATRWRTARPTPPASRNGIPFTIAASPSSASRCRPRSDRRAARSRSSSGARSPSICRRSSRPGCRSRQGRVLADLCRSPRSARPARVLPLRSEEAGWVDGPVIARCTGT